MVKFKFLLLIFLCSGMMLPVITNKQIINNMFNAMNSVQTLKFKLKKLERIDGEMKAGEQDVKFNRNPLKVYTYIVAPNKGVEVLYLEGKNNDHAYINPNAFPFINLNLDPYGSIMRKGNHHTVHEVGFDYIYQILQQINIRSGENFNKYFQYVGDVKFNNRDCFKIVIDYPDYKLVPYTVQPNESLTDIAYKNLVSDYMLMEINKNVDGFDDVTAGEQIMIPNAYAKKTILYIDKLNYLPIFQAMYDEKGLFEQYEFYNVQINPKIEEEEFTKDYKDYGF